MKKTAERICDLCGASVSAQGFKSHRGSIPCQISRAAQEIKARGLVPAGHLVKQLQSAGIKVERYPTSYNREWGAGGWKTKVAYAYFAPVWAVNAYQALRRMRYSVEESIDILSRGVDGNSTIEAVLALEAMAE